MSHDDDLSAALTTVANVDIEYWTDAADEVLTAALADAHFDPEAVEVAVGSVIVAWIRAVADYPDRSGGNASDAALLLVGRREMVRTMLHPAIHNAGASGTRVVVRAPRVRACWVTSFALTGTSAHIRLTFLYAGRRWVEDVATGAVLSGERDTDEAMGDHEYWTLSEDWALTYDQDGRCQIESATSGVLADALGYRYLTRDETTEEFEQRTGAPAQPAVDPPGSMSSPLCRYLLIADAIDDDVRYGNVVTLTVDHPGMPTRAEAAALITPSVLADMRLSRGDIVFQPRFRRLETHRLLDASR